MIKNIDWRSRFKNKSWLTLFLTTIVAAVYQILGMFGVVPSISEDTATEVITLVITVLIGLGVIQDPTTPGLTDKDKSSQPRE